MDTDPGRGGKRVSLYMIDGEHISVESVTAFRIFIGGISAMVDML